MNKLDLINLIHIFSNKAQKSLFKLAQNADIEKHKDNIHRLETFYKMSPEQLESYNNSLRAIKIYNDSIKNDNKSKSKNTDPERYNIQSPDEQFPDDEYVKNSDSDPIYNEIMSLASEVTNSKLEDINDITTYMMTLAQLYKKCIELDSGWGYLWKFNMELINVLTENNEIDDDQQSLGSEIQEFVDSFGEKIKLLAKGNLKQDNPEAIKQLKDLKFNLIDATDINSTAKTLHDWALNPDNKVKNELDQNGKIIKQTLVGGFRKNWIESMKKQKENNITLASLSHDPKIVDYTKEINDILDKLIINYNETTGLMAEANYGATQKIAKLSEEKQELLAKKSYVASKIRHRNYPEEIEDLAYRLKNAPDKQKEIIEQELAIKSSVLSQDKNIGPQNNIRREFIKRLKSKNYPSDQEKQKFYTLIEEAGSKRTKIDVTNKNSADKKRMFATSKELQDIASKCIISANSIKMGIKKEITKSISKNEDIRYKKITDDIAQALINGEAKQATLLTEYLSEKINKDAEEHPLLKNWKESHAGLAIEYFKKVKVFKGSGVELENMIKIGETLLINEHNRKTNNNRISQMETGLSQIISTYKDMLKYTDKEASVHYRRNMLLSLGNMKKSDRKDILKKLSKQAQTIENKVMSKEEAEKKAHDIFMSILDNLEIPELDN